MAPTRNTYLVPLVSPATVVELSVDTESEKVVHEEPLLNEN